MQQLEHVRFPEEAGISSQGILNYIAAREAAGLEHHAIWVMRHGKVAAKLNYAPYDDHTPHMLFSLSKSFCSAAAGFAVQEGLLSWDSKVIDVLPEAAPEQPSEWLSSVTLHHLLCMGSGLKAESDGIRSGTDWARRALACDCDHAPGTHFHYNSTDTYLVSCMVQKVTGMTVRDYLIPRLFVPLGMMAEGGAAPEWDCSPDGVNMGGWGLYLSCEQIAPFSQCLLQKGMWDGKQVLPREWIDRATTAQIDNGNGEHPHDHDWNMGYGYQFWMCKTDHEPGQTPRYRGDGALSQFVIVDEKRDMVVCCVSGVPDIGKALGLMYEHLFAAADMPPADEDIQAVLQQKLTELSYPWPTHDGSDLPVGVYVAEEENVMMTIDSNQVGLPMPNGEIAQFTPGCVTKVGSSLSCCGMQDGALHLLLRMPSKPFTVDVAICFDDEGDAALILSGIGPDPRTIHMKKIA